MAGGAVVQVIAVGQQDMYLTQSPMITFFKSVYRRYTNFAIESVEQQFNGQAAFGSKTQATITRNGDLVWKIYLQAQLPACADGWVPEIGHALIDYVSVSVGGQQIDKHYGEWLSIWNELTLPAQKRDAYDNLIGNTSALKGTSAPATKIYVPLQFWFNRNPGLALPLIALAYHEVKIEVSFRPLSELTSTTGLSLGACSLWVDYIYLDAEERKNFAQNPQEYLIEQLQFTGTETVTSSSSHKSRLSFNHPTKELVFAIKKSGNDPMDFADSADQTIEEAGLQLNGNDRFAARDAATFNIIQPLQHHTACPRPGIYCYSFALKPEEHQPSGSLNLSRIDNATLTVKPMVSGTLYVFAFSNNIFRVMSGMGGVAYNS